MRTLAVMLALTSMRICDSEEDAPPPIGSTATASVEVDYEPIPPEIAVPHHGGTVVVAEDHAIEVLPHGDGEIRAYVIDHTGAPPAPDQTTVVVNVHAADNRPHPLTLVWDANAGYYHGTYVDVTPVPGPIDVSLTVDGRMRRGEVAHYVVLEPEAVAVEVEGPARRQVAGRPDVRVRRPRRPGVSININAPAPPPPPRVNINIGAPAPPSVHIRGGVRVRRGMGMGMGRGWMHGHYR